MSELIAIVFLLMLWSLRPAAKGKVKPSPSKGTDAGISVNIYQQTPNKLTGLRNSYTIKSGDNKGE